MSPINQDVQRKIGEKLNAYRNFIAGKSPKQFKLVQYCGVEVVGAIDVPTSETEARLQSLLAEAFYVDWSLKDNVVYFKVWEFGGPEPTWQQVYRETNLDGEK